MERTPTRHYVDPLDEVWLTCASRIGLRVQRTPDVYASTDGRGTMSLADRDLDADDCLAQMVFHELCHSLIEGPDSFRREDWGLDNTGDHHGWREHACLRLQAHLAARYGLREALAPTTDFRAFYDRLPADPLTPRHDPEVVLAILGLRRANKPPWGPHLQAALDATASIASAAAPYAGDDSLWSAVRQRPAPHPTGLPPRGFASDDNCGGCAWRYRGGKGKAVDRCRQADDARVEVAWPACERFEPTIDCQACGACCRAAYHSVTVAKNDPVVTTHPVLIVKRERYYELARKGDRCAALEGGGVDDAGALDPYRCIIYDDRPRNCREFENAGPHCITARRRVGLSL